MKTDLHELGDQVDDAVEELLVLWPKLHEALPRDAGGNDSERVRASANVFAALVNQDVSGAIKLLRDEASPAAMEARTVLGEPGDAQPVERTVESLGILYRRLAARGYVGEARKLAASVLHWRRVARTAIGLSRRATPLQGDGRPIFCPLHDAPLVTLRHRGDEGTLDETARGDREAIRWRSGGGLYCPLRGCNGEWGPGEFAFLGRLVAEQRTRLSHQESA